MPEPLAPRPDLTAADTGTLIGLGLVPEQPQPPDPAPTDPPDDGEQGDQPS